MSAINNKSLRIASLLPSTTDICISLGLEYNIVGITHECDFPSSSHPLYQSTAPPIIAASNNNSNCNGMGNDINGKKKSALTLTVSHIDPHKQSQEEIDTAVKTSVHNGISLYNLNGTSLQDSKPSIILTQSLCDVCAVAKEEVDEVASCNFKLDQCRVLSLEPETLTEVVGSFVIIAAACGVRERGEELSEFFWEGVQQISHATSLSANNEKPRVLFMEWLNPCFDAGHWIPDMLDQSGCVSALPKTKNTTRKSVQVSWQQIYDSDPDVIIIGCCGFDMKRNEEDAIASVKKLEPLRAYRNNRIYASDGNLYFARYVSVSLRFPSFVCCHAHYLQFLTQTRPRFKRGSSYLSKVCI